MSRRLARRMLPLLLAGAVLTVAACSDDTPGAATAAPDSSTATNGLPPVVVEVSDAEGTTVEAVAGDTIDLVVDTDVTGWSGEVADPTIASFTPGRDDGSAQFNPGLIALTPGETQVTLTDSANAETVTFTLRVADA